jgi:serine/threonine protein phosphatase PrpC
MNNLRWFGLSDRGRIRAQNEDAFLGMVFDAQEAHLLGKVGGAELGAHEFVFAVSDGIGGAAAGEFASRITVEKIKKLLPQAFQKTAAGLEAGASGVLVELYTQIHASLSYLGRSYQECREMGATLSLCWFTPDWLFFAHIGDSRIYHVAAAGGMRQLSHDDTYVGWMFRNGQINEREARSHPRKNILQRALGAGHQFIEPQIGGLRLEKGDAILLCSDGIVDGMFDAQIEEMLRTSTGTEFMNEHGTNPAESLVRTAVEQSGRDNTTAVVVVVH